MGESNVETRAGPLSRKQNFRTRKRRLESHPQSKLHHPRRDSRIDDPESGRAQHNTRIPEFGVIERVEQFGAKLEFLAFANLEIPQHGEVENVATVPAQDAHALVAELVGSRLQECRGVEPA